MATTTLTYFDIAAARGEECRIALHAAGVPFIDERLKPEQFRERVGSTPYGALPYLTVEGHPPIAQSNAILRLVGSMHGLHPAEPYEAARHEAVMGAIEDLRARLGPINRIKDPDEKKKAREEIAAGYLQQFGANIEKQLQGPFLSGTELNVADIKLYVAVGPLMKGAVDHIAADVFKAFPKLTAHQSAVTAHPKVASWYTR